MGSGGESIGTLNVMLLVYDVLTYIMGVLMFYKQYG